MFEEGGPKKDKKIVCRSMGSMEFEPIPSSKLMADYMKNFGGLGRRNERAAERGGRAAEKGGQAKAGGERRVVGGTSSRRLDRRRFGTGPGSEAAGKGRGRGGGGGAAGWEVSNWARRCSEWSWKGRVIDKDGKGGEGGGRRAVAGRRSNGMGGGARRQTNNRTFKTIYLPGERRGEISIWGRAGGAVAGGGDPASAHAHARGSLRTTRFVFLLGDASWRFSG
ncbi:hypothetical protein B0H14DRAFT_2577857 [Mycena olivaceomarginata]|nr:hypothetical protein B0H14DRAFT_2577857 [Mycena olivaceomarginata]